jgi:hypothetical protein
MVGEEVDFTVKLRHIEQAVAKEGCFGCIMIGFESTEGGWEVPLDRQACLLETNERILGK